eukprot:14752344-Alexandrium_andersonii.AAC.1
MDLLLATPGAHWVKALLARPGTLWLEPVCPGVVDRISWLNPAFVPRNGAAYGGIAAAFGLRYHAIMPEVCPTQPPNVRDERWVPFQTWNASSGRGEPPLRPASSVWPHSPPAAC